MIGWHPSSLVFEPSMHRLRSVSALHDIAEVSIEFTRPISFTPSFGFRLVVSLTEVLHISE